MDWNPLDPRLWTLHHLFSDPGVPPLHPIYWAFLVVFALALLVAAPAYVYSRNARTTHRFRARLARRLALALASVGSLGLLFLVFRYYTVPLLSWRVWVYTALAAVPALGVYYLYYLWRVYPAALRAYEEEERRRRYLPKPKAVAASTGARRKRQRRHH